VAATDDTVYVYGILSASEQQQISSPGVGGSTVSAVEHRGLTALMSRMQDLSLRARDVRAHWRVLEEAFERSPVLPVRFGTVLESEEAVRERLLEPEADRLRDVLSAMSGLVQLNVKGRYNEELLLREIVGSCRDIAQLRERLLLSPQGVANQGAQIKLGQLISGEVARHRDHDTAFVLESLEPLAQAVTADEVAHPQTFSLAFLVASSDQQAFNKAVVSTADALGQRIEIDYVGPLPPFSFAAAAMGNGSATWG
jgi:Gas vesicle synthesis protein GvpL/GvpF